LNKKLNTQITKIWLENKLLKSPGLFKSFTIIFFILGLILVILGITWLYILQPVSKNTDITKITIDKGLEADEIARLLEEKKLIRNHRIFLLLVKLKKASRKLKAGEYILSPHMSYFDILGKLEDGEVVLKKFTVPEGMTIKLIAELWEKYNFGKLEDFIKAASQTELLSKLGINPDDFGISNLEGYLFPETYQFAEGTDANKVVNLMFQEFYERFGNVLKSKANESEMSIHELVTLASIIEREANIDSERPTISSVYHNRLRYNRKLEADPTVLYALRNYKKKLTYEDLEIDSPYNTYKYCGLPPGPICSPGASSILAAINPANNNYLYFVAKGDGTHYFSRTFREHRRAIAKARNRR